MLKASQVYFHLYETIEECCFLQVHFNIGRRKKTYEKMNVLLHDSEKNWKHGRSKVVELPLTETGVLLYDGEVF